MLTSVYYDITQNYIICVSSKDSTEFVMHISTMSSIDYDYEHDREFIVEYLSKCCIFLGYL